jgi:hypothetical protein
VDMYGGDVTTSSVPVVAVVAQQRHSHDTRISAREDQHASIPKRISTVYLTTQWET